MLKNEEKLHLDKHYERMQSLTAPSRLGSLLTGILSFVALYLLFSYLQTLIPMLRSWGDADSDARLLLFGVQFSWPDCVYFTLGLIGFCIEYIRLQDIIKQNHSARADGSYDPDSLLTTGCYAKVRHPMYGAFVLIQASLFLALRSLSGIILTLIVCVFHYLNAYFEEKRTLRPPGCIAARFSVKPE